MDLENGDLVKIKKCKYVERDYWGATAVFLKMTDLNKCALVRCQRDCDLTHAPDFKCKIECLEKLSS